MKNYVVSALLAVTCTTAMGLKKITCEIDQRPVDGNLESISAEQVSPNSNQYTITSRVVTSGQTGWVEETKRTASILCDEVIGGNLLYICSGATNPDIKINLSRVEMNASAWGYAFDLSYAPESPFTDSYYFNESDCAFEN